MLLLNTTRDLYLWMPDDLADSSPCNPSQDTVAEVHRFFCQHPSMNGFNATHRMPAFAAPDNESWRHSWAGDQVHLVPCEDITFLEEAVYRFYPNPDHILQDMTPLLAWVLPLALHAAFRKRLDVMCSIKFQLESRIRQGRAVREDKDSGVEVIIDEEAPLTLRLRTRSSIRVVGQGGEELARIPQHEFPALPWLIAPAHSRSQLVGGLRPVPLGADYCYSLLDMTEWRQSDQLKAEHTERVNFLHLEAHLFPLYWEYLEFEGDENLPLRAALLYQQRAGQNPYSTPQFQKAFVVVPRGEMVHGAILPASSSECVETADNPASVLFKRLRLSNDPGEWLTNDELTRLVESKLQQSLRDVCARLLHHRLHPGDRKLVHRWIKQWRSDTREVVARFMRYSEDSEVVSEALRNWALKIMMGQNER